MTVVIGGWPRSQLVANRKDIEANFMATLEIVPEFAARFRAAARETRFVGQSLAGFMRKPFGASAGGGRCGDLPGGLLLRAERRTPPCRRRYSRLNAVMISRSKSITCSRISARAASASRASIASRNFAWSKTAEPRPGTRSSTTYQTRSESTK